MLDAPTAPQFSAAIENPDQLLRRLHDRGRQLKPNIRANILALRSAAVPPLLEALQDENLLHAKEEDGGWAPLHAAELLAELRAEESIEPMLAVLARVDSHDWMRQTLEESLVEFGDAALEATLGAHANSTDDDYRDSLCTVLAKLEIQDDRIFSCLVAQLERNSELGAMSLAEYDDPRAIEHLSQAFDDHEVNLSRGVLASTTTIELRAAIHELGGSLTAAQERKYRRSQKPADQWRRELHAALGHGAEARREKIGRNEPCWCESGRKYKKCHLRSDEADRN